MDSQTWLASSFVEVSALDFYRDLFPAGSLDAAGAFTPGKYCGIAVQVTGRNTARRYSITDELDNIEELVGGDTFTVISPMSYAGKTQQSRYQRYCYALAIDLDNLLVKGEDPVGIKSLLSQMKEISHEGKPFSHMPKPTYIVASSANNVHLYYLFEKPIPMWKSNKESLARYKTNLTDRLWNIYVTKDYQAVQQEPIGQGMRAVGSIAKDGKGRVRAYKVGGRVSIEYMNRYPFTSEENKIEIWDSPRKFSKPKEKKQRGLNGSAAKKPFYDYYKRELLNYTAEGKRYFGLLVLAVVGKKCGIPYEQVEKDALNFVPLLDTLTKNKENRFTKEDALKAITAYDVPHFMFMKRETLVRLSGVPMEANKRNGRTQDRHMVYLNGMNRLRREMGEEFATGRPKKQQLVCDYKRVHPEMSNRQIAEALGVSRNTVNKWVKQMNRESDVLMRLIEI